MMYSNFTQQVWYTPQSEINEVKPTRFLLQTIPYKFISLSPIYTLLEDSEELSIDIETFLISNCIIDYENIFTDIPKEEVLSNFRDYFGKTIVNDVIQKIIDLWAPNNDFLSTLVTTVELMIDPRFSNATWNCHNCQERGLDRQRNCPMLGPEFQDPRYKLPFMEETVVRCPVDKKDEELGKVILEGYNFREINQLPESGGVGNQPILFVLGTQHLAERLKYFQRKAEEEAISNARRK